MFFFLSVKWALSRLIDMARKEMWNKRNKNSGVDIFHYKYQEGIKIMKDVKWFWLISICVRNFQMKWCVVVFPVYPNLYQRAIKCTQVLLSCRTILVKTLPYNKVWSLNRFLIKFGLICFDKRFSFMCKTPFKTLLNIYIWEKSAY